jgi:putative ABC transport system permease protein
MHFVTKEEQVRFPIATNPTPMIRNYFKVALRSIIRSKMTAFINIFGLAIAMTCAVLIFLYLRDETRYDAYNKNADRTYRVTRDFLSQDGSVNLRLANIAPPIGPLIKNDFGEIEVMARTINAGYVIGLEENGDLKKAFTENNLYLAEPDIFKIFDFSVTSGNPATALDRPFTVMLSEKVAEKYFGTQNVIGKRLRAGNRYDIEVTGTYKSLPAQSHWHPDLLMSFSTFNDSTVYGRAQLETNWGNNAFGTYILLDKGTDPKKIEAQMPAFLDKHFGPYAIANFGAPPTFVASKATQLHIDPLTDIHLRSHRDDELEANGNINNVYMLGVIGLFILLIACFNFINLSTARATRRAKEVGLRKVAGAFRNQLVVQYLCESVLISLFALVLAIVFSIFSLPWLNSFTGKQLSFDLVHPGFIQAGLLGFAVVVGILAGVYPALVVSGFKPATVLKSVQGLSSGKGGIRKTLVVTQFAISIVLIIATAITSQQLEYLNTRNLGYDKDRVVTVNYYRELRPAYEAFHNELMKDAAIQNVCRSSRIPTGRLLDSYGGASVMKGDSLVASTVNLKSIAADEDFFNTYEIAMAAGRSFSKTIRTDDSLAFIVNETAANQIGWKNPKDQIGNDFQYAGVRGKLIGVVKDFHFESLHQAIVPMIFLARENNYGTVSIKISGKNVQQGLVYLEKVWKEFLPNRPFDFSFVSESYRQLYQSEQRENLLFRIFSCLAVLIACLGLFGLTTFSTIQRIKEIGIRKVLGASVPNILVLLSREIVVLVVVANIVAWPMAWYLMNKWLGSFAYHVDPNTFIYLAAAGSAILLAVATVSAQTIKAALTNPAKTLRYE